jgi:site-specific recombinase XerD
MGRRGTSTRIEDGIYRDPGGYRVVGFFGETRREERWPLGTDISTLRDVRGRLRAELSKGAPPPHAKGTLVGDVDRYVTQITYLASWRERRAELKAWVALFGPLQRRSLTAEHVRIAMSRWRQDGRAPKTIVNRVRSLQTLYRALDGRRAVTPCDDVTLPAVPRTVPQAIDPAMVVDVAAQLLEREQAGLIRSAKTRARFMVLASTGKRPSEVMRAEPGDVDLQQRVWRVRDGKGGWSAGLWLNDDMLAAWTLFAAVRAWGGFDVSAFDRTLRAAGWPENVRPYNLRHAFGIALSEQGEDLADIQAMMGHKRIATTRLHYVPVLGGRLREASARLSGRLQWPAEVSAPAEKGKKRA